MHIYVHIALPEKEKERLEAKVTPAKVVFAQDLPEKAWKESFLRAEVVFGNVSSTWLKESTSLRWVQLESAGFGEYLWLSESPKWDRIVMTNLKGMFGIPVAETAVAGILSLYRGINHLSALKEQKEWVGSAMRAQLRTLHNQNVLIAGGGAIGLSVKRLLTGFNCSVGVFGKSPETSDFQTKAELEERLPQADIIISCLPETKETINLFSQERLSMCKPGSVFVNVGRGSVVDEAALIELIRNNHLGGCVLDVTQQEPLPKNHPLWDCPNTILTQHTGGGSQNELSQKVEIFLENYRLYQAGKPLLNIVDLQKTY